MAYVETPMDEVRNLLDEYRDRFGDTYPTYASPDDSYAEVCRKIRACLEDDRPIEMDTSDGIVY